MQFPTPQWLEDLPEGPDKENARTRFLVRLASLYYSRDGFTNKLATRIGLRPNALNAGIAYWTVVPAEVAFQIQETLGDELFPMADLNPAFSRAE
jgi:hypothetical protein